MCVARDGGFATGLTLPISDGNSTVSLKEYPKRVGIESVQLYVGQFGMVVFYYFKCVDDMATTITVLPKAIYYSATPLDNNYNPEQENIQDG